MPERGAELGPLPAGRHNFSPEHVAHNQRERLLAALVEVVNEHGYGAATVTRITAAAQVSRRTFYQQFADKEACFLAAFDVVIEHLEQTIAEAIAGIAVWPDRVGAGIGAMLDFFAAEPELAKLVFVDSLTAGPAVARHYSETVAGFAPQLAPGREAHVGGELPDSTEETVIGGVASVITREVLAGRVAELGAFCDDFVAFVLTPYLGGSESSRSASSGPT